MTRDPFLTDPFQFIVHHSSSHSSLYNPAVDSAMKECTGRNKNYDRLQHLVRADDIQVSASFLS
jgi:hypothetical protein